MTGALSATQIAGDAPASCHWRQIMRNCLTAVVFTLFFVNFQVFGGIVEGLEESYNWIRFIFRFAGLMTAGYSIFSGLFKANQDGVNRAIYILLCAILIASLPEIFDKIFNWFDS